MSIWSILAENHEALTGLAGVILTALGVGRWRKNVSTATAGQVDAIASTAAGMVVILVKSGLVQAHAETIEAFLGHFRTLAIGAGIRVSPANENRALVALSRALVQARREMVLEGQLIRTGALVQEAAARIQAKLGTVSP